MGLGQKIGSLLIGGESVELIGDVGAGKTTFTKGIARGLRVDEDVQSPSFTISRVYDAPGGLRLCHYDFYRLDNPGVMALELAETLTDPQAITIVEWAGSVADVLPADHITIRIVPDGETGRNVTIETANESIKEMIGRSV